MLSALPRSRGCCWARTRTRASSAQDVSSGVRASASGKRQLLAGLLGSTALLLGGSAAGSRGVAMAATTGSAIEEVSSLQRAPG